MKGTAAREKKKSKMDGEEHIVLISSSDNKTRKALEAERSKYDVDYLLVCERLVHLFGLMVLRRRSSFKGSKKSCQFMNSGGFLVFLTTLLVAAVAVSSDALNKETLDTTKKNGEGVKPKQIGVAGFGAGWGVGRGGGLGNVGRGAGGGYGGGPGGGGGEGGGWGGIGPGGGAGGGGTSAGGWGGGGSPGWLGGGGGIPGLGGGGPGGGNGGPGVPGWGRGGGGIPGWGRGGGGMGKKQKEGGHE
ncbi:hypothetical protein L1987_55438 [Smallanthus sonchifolius]|uniref:Uncharacterized protein n=1 Tax=Smallanthus sonchifolius TaxID=185202 RepID=A0ACB9E9E6_9ASTR|nr:hypothetical protein L1987_55438 [Smallanthus sonchifolius]